MVATNVSLLAAPKNSTFIVNDILLYAASGNGFRFPEKKTREWTEWQGRRPWRCNVQMCVKNKTSSARENAFRPASSINDSSFPTGILNNLPPPFFPSFLPPFPNASIRSDGSSTNQPTICSSGMIGIGDQRKQEEGEEGEEEISRLVGALEARARGNKRGTGPMVGRKPHRGANYSNPVRFPKPYSAVPIRVALVSCVVEFMKRLPHTVCVAVSPSLPPRLPPTDSHFRAKPTRNRPTTDGRFSSPLVSSPSLPPLSSPAPACARNAAHVRDNRVPSLVEPWPPIDHLYSALIIIADLRCPILRIGVRIAWQCGGKNVVSRPFPREIGESAPVVPRSAKKILLA